MVLSSVEGSSKIEIQSGVETVQFKKPEADNI
jgi:hypothetical protein